MRSGNLDRVITIERVSRTLNEYREQVETWTTFATVRAQLIQKSADASASERGTVSETVTTFRMRWLDGLTLNDRVSFEGQVWKIAEIKEIGRRVGLDLRCERVGP